MAPRSLLLALSVLANGPLAAALPPFAFDAVDFTPECAPNAAFDRLLGVLLGSSPADSGHAEPEFDEPLFNAVSGDTHHVLHLDRAANWHGLRLAEIRAQFGVESGPTNYTLAFADSPERVRAVWNARGWNLPPPGETRVVDDRGILTAVGVKADGELALVTCFRD